MYSSWLSPEPGNPSELVSRVYLSNLGIYSRFGCHMSVGSCFLVLGRRGALLVTKNYKSAYSYLVKHLISIMVSETRCSGALACRGEIAYPSPPAYHRQLMPPNLVFIGCGLGGKTTQSAR